MQTNKTPSIVLSLRLLNTLSSKLSKFFILFKLTLIFKNSVFIFSW